MNEIQLSNKGNIEMEKNTIYYGPKEPYKPRKGDVWFDTSNPNKTRIVKY